MYFFFYFNLYQVFYFFFFFFQAEDGIRAVAVTGVQTCALPISSTGRRPSPSPSPRPPMVSRAVGRSSGSTSAGGVGSVSSRAASCRSHWSCRPAGHTFSSSGGVTNPDLTASLHRRDRPMSSRPIHRLRTVLLAAGWLVAGAPGLLAQNTVNLQGRVTGAGGAPLAAAQITVA